MTQLTELLQQLSEIEPAVCRREENESGDVFRLGEYVFWEYALGLCADCHGALVTGSPALAWLRDAVEAECERRGWYFEQAYRPVTRVYSAEVCNREAISESAAHSLLAAFVAACEASR